MENRTEKNFTSFLCCMKSFCGKMGLSFLSYFFGSSHHIVPAPYPSHRNMLAFMLKKKWYHDGHNEDMRHATLHYRLLLLSYLVSNFLWLVYLCFYSVFKYVYLKMIYTFFYYIAILFRFYYCHLRRNKVYISP